MESIFQEFGRNETFFLDFRELFPTTILFESKENTILLMDVQLAEILCDNLLSNALKYAPPDTPISVILEKQSLTVKNRGVRAILKPDQLFNRFYKESDEVKSTGLGLAIVKKICDLYGFSPSYRYENGEHGFNILFQENLAS